VKTVAELLTIVLAAVAFAACGGEGGDIGVIDGFCAYLIDCGEEEDFEVCRQFQISSTAALSHVYGQACGNAWVDVLACETSLPCDDFTGCSEAYDQLDIACGWGDMLPP